jgi:hypothetical protein
MTPPFAAPPGAIAVSFATGTVVIGVVVSAIAVLVFALWRRSAAGSGTTRVVSSGPRTDSHAVSTAATVVEIGAIAPTAPGRPSETVPGRTPDAAGAARRRPPPTSQRPRRRRARRHRRGRPGIAAHRRRPTGRVHRFRRLVIGCTRGSAGPPGCTSGGAGRSDVGDDRRRPRPGVPPGRDRGRRCPTGEPGSTTRCTENSSRIGLPAGFFVAMDTTAADLAVDLVRARLAVERLGRRFEALSSLYSSVRPVLDQLGDLGGALDRAAAIADPWRQSPQTVDLVPRHQEAQTLHQ